MARRNKPMPRELLSTFASNQRLNAELRRAKLPQSKTFAAILRRAADGDEAAAAELDAKFPEWRDFQKPSSGDADKTEWR